MNNKVGGLPGFSGVLEMQNGVVQKSDAMIKIALKIRNRCISRNGMERDTETVVYHPRYPGNLSCRQT